jgi:hypothetical protein
MKILVLSNVIGSVDRLVDMVQQGNSVVAKESPMTTEGLARSARAALKDGSYDLVVVAAQDPIGAGMLLNKQDGIDAAVCDSAEDAAAAKDNAANVVVIKDVRSDATEDILGTFAGVSAAAQRPKATAKLASFSKRPDAAKKEAAPRKAPPARQEEDEDGDDGDGEDESRLEAVSSGRKDLIGKLKNALGII